MASTKNIKRILDAVSDQADDIVKENAKIIKHKAKDGRNILNKIPKKLNLNEGELKVINDVSDAKNAFDKTLRDQARKIKTSNVMGNGSSSIPKRMAWGKNSRVVFANGLEADSSKTMHKIFDSMHKTAKNEADNIKKATIKNYDDNLSSSVEAIKEMLNDSSKKAYKNKENFSIYGQRKSMYKDLNVLKRDLDGVEDIDKKWDIINKYQKNKNFVDPSSAIEKAKEMSAKELNLIQKANYYKIPQATAVGGGAAYLVSRMSNSKGRQSNSELYGQSTPYGNQ